MKTTYLLAGLIILATSFSGRLWASDAPQAPELIGYCPVAYVAVGKVVKGSPDFQSVVDGKTYWFVSADAKQAFDDNPSNFQVACDGYCAYAAAQGAVFPGDPQIFSVKNNSIYFFINAETKKAFDEDPAMAQAAETNWQTLQAEL